MFKGGYVSKETLDSINQKLEEKPSWWLVDGKLVNCCSYELDIIKEIKLK